MSIHDGADGASAPAAAALPTLAARPTATMPRLHIFVGSSHDDLVAHREAVARMLRKMGHDDIVMEDFNAQNGDATTVSLDELARADLALFVVAWRYGNPPATPPDETRSVTHLEWAAAKQWDLSRLVFLADPTTEADADGPNALFPAATRNAGRHQQLLDFRAELARDRVPAYFTTPDDLATLGAAAVTRYLLGKQYAEVLRARGLRPPHDLPPRAPGFVGRERELAQLRQQLREGHSTGLSAAVVGMAGAGKSALAAEAVHQLATEPGLFPGGITFVRCDGRIGFDGLTWAYDQLLAAWNAPLAPEELARATTPEAAAELRERALRTRLRPEPVLHNAIGNGIETTDGACDHGRIAKQVQQALVLFDNAEPGLPLSRLLDALAPLGLTTLVTTRRQPAIPRLQLLRLDVLDPVSAVQLLAERYLTQGGAWIEARDTAPAGTVVEVLGYLPLAVELIAARTALCRMSVAAVAAELQAANRLGRLRDPTDPRRSVRYAFEQSLAQLTPTQQLRFAALSLPAGPDWPRDVVEDYLARLVPTDMAPDARAEGLDGPLAAADADGSPAYVDMHEHAAADLDVLVAHSLATLTVDEGAGDALVEVARVRGEAEEMEGSVATAAQERSPEFASRQTSVRVRVHPLLREFAAAAWMRQPEMVRRIASIALLYAAGTLVHAHAAATQRDFTALAREEALIAGALTGVGTTEDMLGAEHLAVATWQMLVSAVSDLSKYLTIGGHWQLGQSLFGLQLDATRALGNRRGEGVSLNNLGYLANSLGQPEEARHYYEQALAIAREVDNRGSEGSTLNNLGELARGLGQPETARRHYEEALAVAREVGNRDSEGITLNNLGLLSHEQGQPDVARHYYEAALAIVRDVGNRSMEGTTLCNLGVLAQSQGQPETARRYYEEALTILREVGDRDGEGATLNNLGNLEKSLGRPEEAHRYYEEALSFARDVGNRDSEGTTLHNLGELARGLGQPEAARRYYEEALAILREVGNRLMEGVTLNNLGLLANSLGQPEAARRYHEQALTIAREVGNSESEGVILASLGALAYGQGKSEAARRYYEEALTILREAGNRGSEGSTLNNLGTLVRSLGQLEAARRYHEQALTIAREVGNRESEGTALNDMGALAYEQGQLEAARHFVEEALTILREVGDRDGEGATLNNLGLLAYEQGQLEAARRYYEQALVIVREVGNRRGEASVLNGLGTLARRQGNEEAANRYYEEALVICDVVGAAREAQIIRDNLHALRRR